MAAAPAAGGAAAGAPLASAASGRPGLLLSPSLSHISSLASSGGFGASLSSAGPSLLSRNTSSGRSLASHHTTGTAGGGTSARSFGRFLTPPAHGPDPASAGGLGPQPLLPGSAFSGQMSGFAGSRSGGDDEQVGFMLGAAQPAAGLVRHGQSADGGSGSQSALGSIGAAGSGGDASGVGGGGVGSSGGGGGGGDMLPGFDVLEPLGIPGAAGYGHGGMGGMGGMGAAGDNGGDEYY
jgi:hypothetical protein